MAGTPEIARINGRKGGRPPGRKNDATLEREAVERAYNQRVFRIADRLLNAQLTAALGCTYLYRIDEVEDSKGKKKSKAVLVTDKDEIAAFLAGEVDVKNYQHITTGKPDTGAIEAMLDRALGKPVQPVSEQPPQEIQDLPYEQRMRIIRQKYAKGGKK